MRCPGTLAGRLACVPFALVLAACPSKNVEPPKGEAVRVRGFTDATPITAVAVIDPYVFAAGDRAIDRFDLRDGTRTTMNADSGFECEHIHALEADRERSLIWIATERGVTRHDVHAGTFTDLADPPEPVLAKMPEVVMAPAGDQGVYLGGPFGLYQSGTKGGWLEPLVTQPVTSLARAPDGSLWVGTTEGLFLVDDRGVRPLGHGEGVDLASVIAMAQGPGLAPAVLGTNAEGQQRLVLSVNGGLATYRVSPRVQWETLTGSGNRLVARAGASMYELKPHTGVRRLARDNIELLPASPKGAPLAPPSPLTVSAIAGRAPSGTLDVVADDRRIFTATRDLGTGVLGEDGRWRWLRRAELTRGARFLSVACSKRDDCFLANASGQAWRFDGKSFREPGLEDREVLSFVRKDTGEIYALIRAGGGAIGVASFDGKAWSVLDGFEIRLAEGKTELSFASFAPGGLLWLGIGYVDEQGDVRPKGVALVDVGLGAISYHHASHDDDATRRGILPIPINVSDVSFLGMDEVWLATSQGAARLKGTEIKVYSEADGMRSEILRGIACSAAGMVYVGSRQGVGAYDGENWTYPPGLSAPVNDLRFAEDGRLWLATDRGLTSYDGATIRRLDSRRGLLEDEIVDLDIDHYGRLWLRGPESIAVVVP